MPTTRVGVQAVTGSAGQVVDIDPARISATITNASAEAVEYSTGSGWTSIAVSGSATVSCFTNTLRLRKTVAGGYPAPVDINWTAQSEGEDNSLTAQQASSVSGYGTPVVVDGAGNLLNGASGAPVNGPSYTWATRPAAAGNAGRVVRITDIGPGGSYWYSDGASWRPVGGSVLIASQQGSITTPLSAFTGVTSSVFTITQPIIPAGMLIPGSSTIEFEAQLRRTGGNGTALVNVHMGTAKSAGDNTIYAFTYAATTLLDLFVNPSVLVAESGRIVATNWQARGGSGNASVYQERTGNINTAADMGITIAIASANSADSFALLGYKVRLFQ